MAAIPDVGFGATKEVAGIVAVGEQGGIIGAGGATIITGKHNQRIGDQAISIHGGQHLADGPVGLHHKIPIIIDPAFALPCGRRNNGRVRRVQREIQEDRPTGPGVFIQIGDHFAGQRGQHINGFKIRRRRALAPPALFHRGHLGPMIVFNVNEGWHVERTADAEEIIKTVVNGTVGYRPGEVHGCGCWVCRRVAAGRVGRQVQSQMPFAEAGGLIALFFEQGGYGELAGFDEGRGIAVEYPALQAGPPVIAAGKDTVAGGGADGGTAVGIGENHALRGQAIQIRRGQLAAGIETFYITIAEVVRQDVNDIGPFPGGGLSRNRPG